MGLRPSECPRESSAKPRADDVTKHRILDLAIFGGPSQFSDKLHVGRPNIGLRERLIGRIDDMLERRWLTNDGPYVQELEHKLAEYLGVEHCLLVCNGTVALEIAIRALGLSGEVILPSFTFVASAHALQWQQITPVFCDVGMDSHSIDPDRIAELITPRTSGIMGVHVWGHPCKVEALARVAGEHNLRLMYDAAHAFGCSHAGTMIGNFGEAEVFSFHATKFFNTFEGGAIATKDGELARKMRSMRNFGFSGYDATECVGTNGKMSEVSAAMGLTLMESLDDIVRANQDHYRQYQAAFSTMEGVKQFSYAGEGPSNYQYIIAEIDEAQAGISRDTLVRVLHAENVLARRYFYPGCHEMEPYRTLDPGAALRLPNTVALCGRVMSLPTGTAVSSTDIEAIGELIGFALAHGQEITDAL